MDPMIDTYILLIEDEPGSSAMEAEYLKGNGCRVDLVNSRKDAVQATRVESYDLVVFDCKHSDLTNGDVIDWMGDLVGITPMLIITDRFDPERDNEAIETGVLFYMIRGSSVDYLHSLRNTVKHSIHNFRLQSQHGALEKELSGNRKALNTIFQKISEACYLWEKKEDGNISLVYANEKAKLLAGKNQLDIENITLEGFCGSEKMVLNSAMQAMDTGSSESGEALLDIPALGEKRTLNIDYIGIRENAVLVMIRDLEDAEKVKKDVKRRITELEKSVENREKELNSVNDRLQMEISERKTAEEELRMREQQLFQFLDSVPVGIFILDAEGKSYFSNKSSANILGKSMVVDVTMEQMSEVYQVYLTGANELYPSDKMPIVRALSGERCSAIDMEIRNGETVIPLEVWAAPIFNDKGDVIFALAAFIDISDRRQNESEINRLNQYLESIIDNADIWLNVLDKNASVILWNKAAEQISGYSREEVVGHGMIWKWLYPDEKYMEQINRKVEEILFNGISLIDFTTVIQRKDGTKRTISWNSRSLYDEAGESIGSIALGRDVTEQKKMEEMLVEKTDELTERVKELTCLTRITELLTSHDKPMENLLQQAIELIPPAFQHEEDACVRLTVDDSSFVTDNFKETDWSIREEIRIKGRTAGNLELFYRVKHPQSDIGPFLDQEKQLLSIIAGRLELIIERERIERSSLEIEARINNINISEAIGSLAGGIAHEINTPTQFISDNLQFLKETYDDINGALKRQVEIIKTICSGEENDPVKTAELLWREMDIDYLMEEIPNAVKESLEGINRIAQVVKATREFANQTPEEKLISVSINNIIDNIVIVSRNEWKYVADLTTELELDLPPVQCIPGDLSLAILLFIVNAAGNIKDKMGMQPNELGKITVETSRSEKWVELRIADSGAGYTEKDLSQIFDPAVERKHTGSLISQGLPVAHSIIVDKLGGLIEVESEMGRGTSFTVKLPFTEE